MVFYISKNKFCIYIEGYGYIWFTWNIFSLFRQKRLLKEYPEAYKLMKWPINYRFGPFGWNFHGYKDHSNFRIGSR